jgi:glutathione peroxidase
MNVRPFSRTFLWLLTIIFVGNAGLALAQTASLHSFRVKNIQGDSIDLSQYSGKRLMIVNTASYCGFTPQFTQLQQLYQAYQSYNFEILGFPCNDFGNQDPYSDSTINSFCTGNYNVSFPMMSRIAIASGDTSPVYRWLQRADLNGVSDAQVAWNFNKFLVDENGHWVQHLLSNVSPLDPMITNWIMQNPSSLPETSKQKYSCVADAASLRISGEPEKVRMEIFSLSGVPLMQQVVSTQTSVPHLLPQGVYLVRMIGKQGCISQKIFLHP